MKLIKKIICKIFGHKVEGIIVGQNNYCLRCGGLVLP